MAGINEDRERQVIPLWRTFRATSHRGELASTKPGNAGRFCDEMVVALKQEWQNQPDLIIAADLVSVSLTLGRFEIAIDAAKQIEADESASASIRGVAARYLANGGNIESTYAAGSKYGTSTGQFTSGTLLREHIHHGIRDARLRLIAYPNNPVLWGNLALLYTSLGQHNKAEKAIICAMSLAPNNRFVLRSAARFYLHTNKSDYAHRILRMASNVKLDPWLLSAEIATAAALGRTSLNIKVARQMIEKEKFSPFHMSELTSAIGTLESRSGNMRAARQLVSLSLKEPAENAIAQAAWLNRTFSQIGITNSTTCSSEANAWSAFCSSEWDMALGNAKQWLAEQPFSSRPAMLAAHIASVVIQDFVVAVDLAEQGMLCNPDDFALQNAAAFAHAQNDKPEEAIKVYKRVNQRSLTVRDKVVWLATCGLICFRMGDFEGGRRFYDFAIKLGDKLSDDRAPVARLFYALEEMRIGSPTAESLRNDAIELAKSLSGRSYRVVVDRLAKARPSEEKKEQEKATSQGLLFIKHSLRIL